MKIKTKEEILLESSYEEVMKFKDQTLSEEIQKKKFIQDEPVTKEEATEVGEVTEEPPQELEDVVPPSADVKPSSKKRLRKQDSQFLLKIARLLLNRGFATLGRKILDTADKRYNGFGK